MGLLMRRAHCAPQARKELDSNLVEARETLGRLLTSCMGTARRSYLQQQGAGREPREAGVREAPAPRPRSAAVLQAQRLQRRQPPCAHKENVVSPWVI